MKTLLITALFTAGCAQVQATSKHDDSEDFDMVCKSGQCHWAPKPDLDCPSDTRCEIQDSPQLYRNSEGLVGDPVKQI
jgi:hypothetical protein